MSKRHDAAARWRAILQGQASSGLSVAAYCRRARISQASFYFWRRKLREAAAFAEVRIGSDSGQVKGAGESEPRCDGALELVLPGGRSLVVRAGFDRATLLALVEALECGTAQDGTTKVGALHSLNPKRESGA